MLDRITELQDEALAAIDAASDTAALEAVRVRLLGRKAELPNILRGVAELAPEERGAVGKAANLARRAVEERLNAATERLAAAELDARLAADRVDVTLPGRPEQPVGPLHLLTAVRREIEDVFLGLGFTVMEGPEVETVHYNFDALNHDPAHPARARTDTFYVDDDLVLRTHTSPMQIRAMEAQPPPIAIIVPGRVYRRDSDATHTPQFHQVEGLCGRRGHHARRPQGRPAGLRAARSSATSARCACAATSSRSPSRASRSTSRASRAARDGSPCRICKGTGWLEVLGAGMVDPNVLAGVPGGAYDPEKVQGFAFGMGIERIAMLKHGVPDLRLLYDNDVRFLRQFG